MFYKPLVFLEAYSSTLTLKDNHHITISDGHNVQLHIQDMCQVDLVLKIYRSPDSPFVVGGSPINGSDAFSVSIPSVLSVVPYQLYHPVNQPCQLPALPLLSLISRSC